MKERIQDTLREIERSEHVRILYAAESGSRAWGLASEDSDYDVRFIYVHPLEHYLKLEQTSDVIEWKQDDALDISGWDLQKMLRLLQKANPSVFEWNCSPIVYRTSAEWERMQGTIAAHFRGLPMLYQYLHTAKTDYRQYLCKETVRLKKYLHILRSVLACRWVAEHGTPPPMAFSALCDAQLDGAIRPCVEQLVALKKHAPEVTHGAQIPELNAWIEQALSRLTEILLEEELRRTKQQADFSALDRVFLEIVLGDR